MQQCDGAKGTTLLIAAVVVAVCLAVPLPASAQSSSAPATASRPARPFTAAEADACLARAAAWIVAKQDRQGNFYNIHSREYPGGVEALAALALLRAGEAPNSPAVARTAAFLKSLQPQQTYTRALRAMVLANLDGDDARQRLGEDLQWLYKQQNKSGGWGYGAAPAAVRARPDYTDGSNTFLALMALREAWDAGHIVPIGVVRQAEYYWRSFRNDDGGWGYQPKSVAGAQRTESHGSMTAAAICCFQFFADRLGSMSGEPDAGGPDPVAGGLAWLNANFVADRVPKYVWATQPSQQPYYLWILLQAAGAAGLQSLAGQDYAAEAARFLRDTQEPAGSWNDSVADTALAVLCLAEARAPVVMARLQLGDDAGPNPRDAANVARWLGQAWGRPMAWQSLPASAAPEALRRHRLLYVNLSRDTGAGAGGDLPQRLAEFVRDGGTCVIQAPPRSGSRIADALLRTMPHLRRQGLPDNHAVLTRYAKIPPDRLPNVLTLEDSFRTAVFILQQDASTQWQQGRHVDNAHLFDLAGNLVLYANRGPPPSRLEVRAFPAPAPPVRQKLPVARVRHGGDYAACPAAVGRLGNELARSLSLGLDEQPPVDLDRPPDRRHVLLWLTGSGKFTLTSAQVDNLRQYLAEGGTLLLAPAVGKDEFAKAGRELMDQLFGPGSVVKLRPDSPLLTGALAGGAGANALATAPASAPATGSASAPAALTAPASAGAAAASASAPSADANEFWTGILNGRVAALLCPRGLGASLEGYDDAPNCYPAEQARRIALNFIVYAASR